MSHWRPAYVCLVEQGEAPVVAAWSSSGLVYFSFTFAKERRSMKTKWWVLQFDGGDLLSSVFCCYQWCMRLVFHLVWGGISGWVGCSVFDV